MGTVGFWSAGYEGDTFVGNIIAQFCWMTLMWVICIARTNGSMVDFGWPSGFTAMALYYWITGPGFIWRKTALCGLYVLAGVRFMLGWLVGRKHHIKEDHRWELWRERWRNGQGLFGIRSVPFNFFVFYHCQSLTNAFFMFLPLHLAAVDTTPELKPWEYAGVTLWFLGFVIENIADSQLSAFQIEQAKLKKAAEKKGESAPPYKVCRKGLWNYSRHPNYFGELLLWIAYAVFASGSARNPAEYVLLGFLPVVAYYYLVHFTGAWMAEQASVRKRGQAYIEYQNSTSMIIPWFPKRSD